MSARNKLNAAYITGSFVVARIIGLLTGSWTVFGIYARVEFLRRQHPL
jgi:hypothetical protein